MTIPLHEARLTDSKAEHYRGVILDLRAGVDFEGSRESSPSLKEMLNQRVSTACVTSLMLYNTGDLFFFS